MGRKTNELYQYHGQMMSAYAIAKETNNLHSLNLIRKRLRKGMAAERATQIEHRPENKMEGMYHPITQEEIGGIRNRLQIGQRIRLLNRPAMSFDTDGRRKPETCVVIAKHKHLAIFLRPCGQTVPRTYVDLVIGE